MPFFVRRHTVPTNQVEHISRQPDPAPVVVLFRFQLDQGSDGINRALNICVIEDQMPCRQQQYFTPACTGQRLFLKNPLQRTPPIGNMAAGQIFLKRAVWKGKDLPPVAALPAPYQQSGPFFHILAE